jgi:predicted signal transduction protein with EAL and GGDEF domain
MSLRDEQRVKHEINMMTQTNTKMSSEIFTKVVKDQQDAFLEYTNIKTIRARLSQKKIVSADFLDVVNGWFRAQYITVNASIDGIPNEVIFTTRNVDEEKRREEHLIRISMTDEMTRLFNRRSYEDDLAKYRANGIEDDFVLFSVDVNGLKTVNDTKGHAAGDELIKGTADCLSFIVGNRGKAYRTGGDEFMAVIHTREPEDIRCAILNKSNEWRGVYSDDLSV